MREYARAEDREQGAARPQALWPTLEPTGIDTLEPGASRLVVKRVTAIERDFFDAVVQLNFPWPKLEPPNESDDIPEITNLLTWISKQEIRVKKGTASLNGHARLTRELPTTEAGSDVHELIEEQLRLDCLEWQRSGGTPTLEKQGSMLLPIICSWHGEEHNVFGRLEEHWLAPSLGAVWESPGSSGLKWAVA
eukprot:4406295-Prymnesium_polylepis.1